MGYLITSLAFICFCYSVVDADGMQQVHVIFRHGERTPDLSNLYPNDPYRNDTWHPDGYGQLTMNGKIQTFKLGQDIRRIYGRFLKKLYFPDLIEPLSTDYNRTKMSLELVLAGLFPPEPTQTWNDLLPWQPIPFNYVSWNTDPVMRFSLFYCQKYTDLYNKAIQHEKFQNFFKSNKDLIEYINYNTGHKVENFPDLFTLYGGLKAENDTGRKLPEWTNRVFPDFLEKAAVLYYELQSYTDELRKFSGGNMIKKILNDMKAKRDATLVPKQRKMFLYSGHEYNIGYLLGALKVLEPQIPPYASYVVLELHKNFNLWAVKVAYQNYNQPEQQYLKIPGCQILCPLITFEKLLDSVIPKEGDSC